MLLLEILRREWFILALDKWLVSPLLHVVLHLAYILLHFLDEGVYVLDHHHRALNEGINALVLPAELDDPGFHISIDAVNSILE